MAVSYPDFPANDGAEAPFAPDDRGGSAEPLPPHDIEAEHKVLGNLLYEPERFSELDGLETEHFFSEARQVWTAILAVAEQGRSVSIETVSDQLRSTGRLAQVGGLAFVTELVALTAVYSKRQLADVVGIILRTYRERQTLLIADRLSAQVRAGHESATDLAIADLQAVAAARARGEPPPTLWASDLARTVEPIAFVCKDLTIAPGRPSVLAGEGGTRKGWWAQEMQICGAADLRMLGRFRFPGPMRSVYFDYEQTERVSRERFQLLAKGHSTGAEGARSGEKVTALG